ncbi:MAG: HD domain-containing protein [Gemmatimonadota bacterium]
MTTAGRTEPMARARTVRDPVWGNIRLDRTAAAVLDTAEFQRLRRVKQLGFADLVYPGAVHTRFLHALGVYHLTGRAIELLRVRGDLDRLDAGERAEVPLVRLAALLHDVGHYAFSHAMEEVARGSIPGDHEEVAASFLTSGAIESALAEQGPEAAARITALIRGTSTHPLQGLVSGSLDLDKIDYLTRDSFFCGVPYGSVDVARLLDALCLARETEGAPLEVGVTEKGLSALESLLFSKYQMFRNVYWHHTVRAATVVFRRLVETALAVGLLRPGELAGPTDEDLLGLLEARWKSISRSMPDLAQVPALLEALSGRRLPKRAVELFGDRLPAGIARWMIEDPALVRRVEERLAGEWGLPGGSLFLDYPAYPDMLRLRLLVVRRGSEVRRLTSAGEKGLIDLPRLSASLHHSARVFRIFTLQPVDKKDPTPLLSLLEASGSEVEGRLREERALY